MMREPEWIDAHVAAATDCIDIPLDNRFPLLHCDLNTGLVFMRSTPKARPLLRVFFLYPALPHYLRVFFLYQLAATLPSCHSTPLQTRPYSPRRPAPIR